MEEAEGIALALEDKMRLLRRAGKDFDLDELTRTLALRCQIVKSQRQPPFHYSLISPDPPVLQARLASTRHS